MPRFPFLVGLTGSIGMGKSTVSSWIREEGFPVWDADAAVHALYAPGGAAVPIVAALFAGDAGVVDVATGGVDRAALGRKVLGDSGALARLEDAVHPLVAAHREAFLEEAAERGDRMVVLDVPLLFEAGMEVRIQRCRAPAEFCSPVLRPRSAPASLPPHAVDSFPPPLLPLSSLSFYISPSSTSSWSSAPPPPSSARASSPAPA